MSQHVPWCDMWNGAKLSGPLHSKVEIADPCGSLLGGAMIRTAAGCPGGGRGCGRGALLGAWQLEFVLDVYCIAPQA